MSGQSCVVSARRGIFYPADSLRSLPRRAVGFAQCLHARCARRQLCMAEFGRGYHHLGGITFRVGIHNKINKL